MHDIAEFLKGHDPFTGLDEEALERLAERTEVEFFAAGTTIFKQGEQPQSVVRVVRRGSVELVDGGRVLDLLGEGELFGHPSMLSGLPTGFEARAHEDSLVYAFPAAEVKPLLARPSSLGFVTKSLLRRLKPGSVGDPYVGSAEMARQTAKALIRRRPIVLEPATTLREAAQRMAEEGASSVLIRGEDGELGILTDSDFRSVVGNALPIDAPVGEAMSAPVFTVGPEQSGADVMLTMLDHDIRHVPVVSPRSEVLGVIIGIDLVAAEARAPFVLRRAIAEAKSAGELAEIAGRLRSTVVALHNAHLPAVQISQVVSAVADALIRRMIEFAIEAEGWPPVEFAWLQLGSHGRREPVLSSDLDSGMSWRDIPEGKEISGPRRVLAGEPTERYMHAVAHHVARTVKTLGWKLDPHGVNASGSFSASSIEDWREAIGEWLSHPDHETVLIATSILLDGRVVYGDESLNPKPILASTKQHRATLLRWMLRLALTSKPPTGFRRDIVVESSGEHRGTFDIKHGGLLPITDLARYAALRAESDAVSTVDRLHAGADAGVFDPAPARSLEEAFDLFSALRIEHQVQQVEAGLEPDDRIDPKELNQLTRRYLRDAFREVSSVQRAMSGELRWGTG
jgi:CBS domain-containing protein